jgi:hypothetical protein
MTAKQISVTDASNVYAIYMKVAATEGIKNINELRISLIKKDI